MQNEADGGSHAAPPPMLDPMMEAEAEGTAYKNLLGAGHNMSHIAGEQLGERRVAAWRQAVGAYGTCADTAPYSTRMGVRRSRAMLRVRVSLATTRRVYSSGRTGRRQTRVVFALHDRGWALTCCCVPLVTPRRC